MESRIRSKVSNKNINKENKRQSRRQSVVGISSWQQGDGEVGETDPASTLWCWLLLTFLIIIIIKGHLLVQMKQNKNRIPHYSASS